MAKKKLKRAESGVSLAGEIRGAIADCGMSANKLAKKTGVSQPTITRFIAGADMKVSTAGILVRHLGLRLQATDGKKAATTRKRKVT